MCTTPPAKLPLTNLLNNYTSQANKKRGLCLAFLMNKKNSSWNKYQLWYLINDIAVNICQLGAEDR
jgi:hypothetical protein